MSKHRQINKIGVVTDGSVIIGFDDDSHTYLTSEDIEHILETLKAIAAEKIKFINEEE